ncbi:MAG: hypothetical protein FWG73_06900 [Planctomycetaceae bacterium]|nr:hypothetical protein [Planctomycetaceae bacterium]
MKVNDMVILTGRYYNKAIISGDYTFVGISRGNARFLKYRPVYLKALAPPANVVKIEDKDEYSKLYRQQLDDLGIESVQALLSDLYCGKPIVLLCYEDLRNPANWCHRTMFAEWYKEQTGCEILEIEEA